VLVALLLLVPTSVHAQGSLLADLQAARAKYPTPMSPAQLAELLNAVAWDNKDQGWGLLSKPGGNRCPQPTTGIDVSCDWLTHLPTAKGLDVLGASEKTATPRWGSFSTIDRARFVAPVRPAGVDEPVDPVDPVEPDPVDPGPRNAEEQLAVLQQILEALQRHLSNLELSVRDLTIEQRNQAAALEAGLAAVKAEIAKGIKVRF
jgi:hypothetical protein